MAEGAARVAWTLLAFALDAGAATLEVAVKDERGAPVTDAVVWAEPKAPAAQRPRREAAVEQRDKTFVPMVSVVQSGTMVKFPNRDPIRHHVYSFSPPKPFELKLYAGTTAPAVLFDKPGEVVLGCNIHDTMLGFIYVVDTPFFAKTGADGTARLSDLPAGEYSVQAWHYAQAAPAAAQAARLRADESLAAAFTVTIKASQLRAEKK